MKEYVSLLRLREVMRRTGLSRSQIYRMVRSGTFPQRVKLGPGARARASAWPDTEVAQWIFDCMGPKR